jgi:cold shock CspA family protein
MMNHLPRSVRIDGRPHHLTGLGKARGVYGYLNAADGRLVELVLVQLTTVGPGYAFGTVVDNAGFPPVTISPLPSGPATQPGSEWLAGPLRWSSTGPVASAAWMVRAVQPRPFPADRPRINRTPVSSIGVVASVNGVYGFITPANGGPDMFFHRSGCVAGQIPVLGCRVSYQVAPGPRGTPVGVRVTEL